MPSFVTTIRTLLPPGEVWNRVSDVTRFADWDPGVVSSRQVDGDGPAVGARYELVVKALGGPLPLVYEVVELHVPERLVLVADTGRLRSRDVITVTPGASGADPAPGSGRPGAGEVEVEVEKTVLTYDAELSFSGLAAVANPVLALAFGVIGRRAAAGLATHLEA